MHRNFLVPFVAVLFLGVACNASFSVFTEGGEAGGNSAAGGRQSGTTTPTGPSTGGSDPTGMSGGGEIGGFGAGGDQTGGFGQGGRGIGGEGIGGEGIGGGEPGEFECGLQMFCQNPDADACVCQGCNDNGECGQNEDCMCADCINAQGCQGCANGAPSGVCAPYFEGCSCSDCDGHPFCSNN